MSRATLLGMVGALGMLALANCQSSGCESPESAAGAPKSPTDGRTAPTITTTSTGDSASDAVPGPGARTATANPPLARRRPGCEAAPFSGDHVPKEASGAVVLSSGDVLVVSDSGHRGAFAILGPDGALRTRGALPLGEGASDDLEGLTRRGDEIYGITSSGWIRHWRRHGDALSLFAGPYPIDPSGAATCAEGTSFNCGPNYEGLCLRPAGVAGACDGFAVANAEAALRCLAFDSRGRLQLVAEPVLRVGFPGQLSGCSIAPTGELWVVANRLGGNAVALVDGWSTPQAARLRLMSGSPAGFVEAVAAAPDDVLFVFSDQDQSLRNHRKYRCPR